MKQEDSAEGSEYHDNGCDSEEDTDGGDER